MQKDENDDVFPPRFKLTVKKEGYNQPVLDLTYKIYRKSKDQEDDHRTFFMPDIGQQLQSTEGRNTNKY